ncbi:hypothetical protein, partial [uncultured Brachyspira sp.]
MQKNIALQLFGHLRSYEYVYISLIEKIVIPNKKKGYNVDIFIHTWNETDHSTKTWHNQKAEQRGTHITEKIKNQIIEIYNPKKILITEQIDVEDNELKIKVNDINISYKVIVNMAYTKYMVNKLRMEYSKDNNIKYDYVITTRPDILFKTEFIIDDFLKLFTDNNIPIPNNAIFYGYKPFARGLVEYKYFLVGSDIIYFAKEETMNKATNLYQKIENKVLDINYFKDNLYTMVYISYSNWILENLEPIPIKYLYEAGDYIIVRTKDANDIKKKTF